MSDYLITGKKGGGKSLVAVGRIRDALMQGRAVATNLDLYLDKLLPPGHKKVRCYRLPDYPTVADMEAIGKGSDKLDESTYGEIVLDELAVWMGSRTFGQTGRQALLDWFTHSRKHRWNTNFICQAPDQIDKQVRTALMDHQVQCRRLDKMRIPYIGALVKLATGHELRPPKIHVARVQYGMDFNAPVADRWTYRGVSLYEGYDTEQVFREDYSEGLFSYLPPFTTHGRYMNLRRRPSEVVRAFFTPVERKRSPKPRTALVATIAALPAEERMKHMRRLQLAGAL